MYTFNQRKALDNLSLEFLTITHPFITGALQYFQSDYQPNKALLFCKGEIPRFSLGTNYIFIYRFEIQSMEKQGYHHNEERIFVQANDELIDEALKRQKAEQENQLTTGSDDKIIIDKVLRDRIKKKN